MDQRAEVFIYHAKCTADMCKKVFKNIEKTAALTHNAFDAFAYAVKEYMEEKNMEKKCKFKVGDKVINNRGTAYYHTRIGFIGEVTEICNADGMMVKGKSMDNWLPECSKNGEWLVDPHDFDLYTPHQGKILIMVDEKDNNKIIARDLIANKTAEAKCNPKDEWDFNKGAKLALDRLTESEKPKGWTGKVVCISNTVEWFGRVSDNFYFEPGRVYNVIDGDLYYAPGYQYSGIEKVTSPKDLVKNQDGKCPVHCNFIEYKGEVTDK